jgi:hypothetical protein
MVSDIAWTPAPTKTAKLKIQLPIVPPLPPCRHMLAWPFVRELYPMIPALAIPFYELANSAVKPPASEGIEARRHA